MSAILFSPQRAHKYSQGYWDWRTAWGTSAWLLLWRYSQLAPEIDPIGLLPDTQNCGLRIRRECRERFPHHRGLAILYALRHVHDARVVMHAWIAN